MISSSFDLIDVHDLIHIFQVRSLDCLYAAFRPLNLQINITYVSFIYDLIPQMSNKVFLFQKLQ